MKYLLDTNVISEMMKKTPNPGVIDFIQRMAEENLYLSTVIVGELHDGIARLPAGKRKRELDLWVSNDLMRRFQGRILGFGIEEAETWGRQRGAMIAAGKTPPAIDSMVAAIALANNCTLVTRNTEDFQTYANLPQLNPFVA